jgi:hypothetical protein
MSRKIYSKNCDQERWLGKRKGWLMPLSFKPVKK